MYRYRRLLVALSLTEQDEAAIRYAGLISRLAKSEKITFMHVTATLVNSLQEVQSEFPDLKEASGETGKKIMQELVA
ncbi:MAG: hypothetical protein R6V60_04685, partial [Desulfobacterales bacterium]